MFPPFRAPSLPPLPCAMLCHVQRSISKDKALYGQHLSLLSYSPACIGFSLHEGEFRLGEIPLAAVGELFREPATIVIR
jgi:hypothetical protein